MRTAAISLFALRQSWILFHSFNKQRKKKKEIRKLKSAHDIEPIYKIAIRYIHDINYKREKLFALETLNETLSFAMYQTHETKSVR